MNFKEGVGFSKHVSWKEGVYSRTADRRGLDNIPGNDEILEMINIAEDIVEIKIRVVAFNSLTNNIRNNNPSNVSGEIKLLLNFIIE